LGQFANILSFEHNTAKEKENRRPGEYFLFIMLSK
jgi:hypothetical protein